MAVTAEQSQPVQALANAQAIRIRRAALKYKLKSGELSLDRALDEPAFASMLIWDLLLALPGFRVRRAQQLVDHVNEVDRVGFSCFVQVGRLSQRQRTILLRQHSLMGAR